MNVEPEETAAELDAGLEEASRLADAGELEHALQLLLELDRDHSSDPTLLCMIGVVANHLGAEGMATDYFRRCLAEDPTDPEILVRAGAGLSALGDPAAEPALRTATLMAPGLAAAHLQYGGLLIRSGLLDQGMEELRTAIELDRENPDGHRELGIGYYLAGRNDDALEQIERAVDLDESDAAGRVLLGLLLLLHEDDIQRAAEQLHAAAAESAEDAELQLLMALVFGLTGWMDEAWLAVSRAETASEPADPVLVRAIEEALEEGEISMRSLLLDDLGPTALRAHVYRVR